MTAAVYFGQNTAVTETAAARMSAKTAHLILPSLNSVTARQRRRSQPRCGEEQDEAHRAERTFQRVQAHTPIESLQDN